MEIKKYLTKAVPFRNGCSADDMRLSPSTPVESQDVGPQGMSVLTTVLFTVGYSVGAGVLGLPHALCGTGWVGIIIFCVCALASMFTADLLGRCLVLVLERHSEQQDILRYPYPAIGQAAYGNRLRLMISVGIDVSMLGQGVVYLLMASQNMSELVSNLHVDIPKCFWQLIICAVICPVCWCGTPKDFWLIGVGAAGSIAAACVLLLIAMGRDAPQLSPSYDSPFKWTTFLMSFGMIFFAFGSHPSLPTFQADMKQPNKFNLVCLISYSSLSIIYIVMAVEGFLVYGSKVQPSIVMSMMPGPMLVAVQILVTIHLLCAFVIVTNPVCQEGEEILKISPYFSYQRILFRTCVVCLALFIALSIPQFGAIMSLVGGSSIAVLMFVVPPVCYLKLCSMKGPWEPIEVPLHEKVACVEIIIVGAALGASITATALEALVYSEFSKPCYLS
ncbi:hypothetical protein RRG08_058537 [Elysia crispata]|uniref:Amino acid transporter transmembrane domain-containing protein n=1 Tax=Elysia crispata TaxID=231223 RepID=A0AAE1DXA9_9GAST|nr:hypothetical protein RRG08_058537 [Elysia crispata]